MLAGRRPTEKRPTEKPSLEIEGVCADKYGLDLWSVDIRDQTCLTFIFLVIISKGFISTCGLGVEILIDSKEVQIYFI